MKKLFEMWKLRKKKVSLTQGPVEPAEPERDWLGWEAMILPEVIEERKVKQKKRKK